MILDIFGQNAHTLEGKAQVELALLRYRLPRLRRGADAKLSQQRGGVGARFGGGETKIEVDRRRIMRRINKLERDLASLADTRELQRKGRGRSGLASVAIVGYTNAGKSSLLNRLTDSGVLVEDRLFATLDPTTRRLALPGGEPVLLSDTVGFINRLPHGLVESFKGTLEVAALADYLVHVVDASAPDPEGQIDAVREVLGEIDATAVPELLVFNKADLAPDAAEQLVARPPGFGGGLGDDRRGHRRVPAHDGRSAAGAQRRARTGRALRPRRHPGCGASRGRSGVGGRRPRGVDDQGAALRRVGGSALRVRDRDPAT